MAEREGDREKEIAGGQGIAGDKKESTNIQARGWRRREIREKWRGVSAISGIQP